MLGAVQALEFDSHFKDTADLFDPFYLPCHGLLEFLFRGMVKEDTDLQIEAGLHLFSATKTGPRSA